MDLTRDLKEKLDKIKGEKTYATLIRELLSSGSVAGSAEMFDREYDKGYEEAQKDYRITYPCSVCGKSTVKLLNRADYRAMKEYMKEHGWGHKICASK